MRLFRIFFAFVVFTICVQPSTAKGNEIQNDYTIELLTEETGFVSYEIYSIVQDKKGFLWFGTGENGIMRYDSRKVMQLEASEADNTNLSHNEAGNLMHDKQGNIWVGTWGAGVNKYNPKSGRFEYFNHSSTLGDSISGNRIQSLFQDSDGQYWFGSYADGLNLYLGQGKFKRFPYQNRTQQGPSHNRIWDIEELDSQRLLIATSYGLNIFNKSTETFSSFLPDPNSDSPTGANEIRNILVRANGDILVGTQNGPFLFDVENGHFFSLLTDKGDKLGQINSVIEDHSGNIWLVSSTGLFVMQRGNEHFEYFPLGSDNSLRIVFEDSSGVLWVTSEIDGIYKLSPNRKFRSINQEVLVSPNAITTDSDGNLLIVTATSSLYRWHVSEQTLELLVEDLFQYDERDNQNRQQEKPAIYYSKSGLLWVAQDDSLVSYELATDMLVFHPYPKTASDYLEFREIRVLNEDREGNLWIGSYKSGIFIYNLAAKTFKRVNVEQGLAHPEVLEIVKDNADNIWIGTGDGVSVWHPTFNSFSTYKHSASQKNSLLGNIVQDIHVTPEGAIWIGTSAGLNRFVPENSSFQRFDKSAGLPSSLIRGIVNGPNGELWLSTNKGIAKFDTNDFSVVTFDQYDGLLGSDFYESSLVKAKNGMIFSSSQRGIEYFQASTKQSSFKDNQIVLTGFKKLGKKTELPQPYAYTNTVDLDYADYFFTFEFAVLDFLSAGKNRYAYKLVGFNESWVEIGEQNIVTFTNLDGGNYIFLVKATNSQGDWGNNLLKLKVNVAYPPWQTWWAMLIYFVVFVAFIFGAIAIRTRSQQNEINRQKLFVQRLEEQVAEKTFSLNEQARDLKEANQKLERLTYQDGLTGLYNRRYFDQCLEREIKRHLRDKQNLSLIICDIDHFKAYNDFYGHVAGDNCLKQVARTIVQCVSRANDACCRYGGEEFAIILPNANEAQSTHVAEKLRASIEQLMMPHQKSATSDFLTMTLGVVTLMPEEQTEREALIELADKALYIGKTQGRNRVSR